MPCTVLGGSLCIFSCLLLASTKWHKQNKEPISEHLWDWVGEVCFYRGRRKRKYLPPGQGLFILLVILRLHLRALMPSESPEGFCVQGRDHWHFEQSEGDDFWKCSGHRHLPKDKQLEKAWSLCFQEAHKLAWKKRHDSTGSLNVLDSI